MVSFRRFVIVSYFFANGVWLLSALLGCGWNAVLSIENHHWFLSQNNAPLWDPPIRPSYAAFASTFEDLPQDMPARGRIRVAPDLISLVITILIGILGTSVIAGVCAIGMAKPGMLFSIIQMIALMMTASALLCFVTWLLLGGWGPPAPHVFAAVGLIAGWASGVRLGRKRRQSEAQDRRSDPETVSHP